MEKYFTWHNADRHRYDWLLDMYSEPIIISHNTNKQILLNSGLIINITASLTSLIRPESGGDSCCHGDRGTEGDSELYHQLSSG